LQISLITKDSTMARQPRLSIGGIPQHVIQRGNNRQPSFYCNADFSMYLECLADAAMKHGCLLHHYVLMTNHVHLLMTPVNASALALTMQQVGRRFVRYINSRHERSGTLWEGRYRANLVEARSYFLTCCRYIELNPVRADMVALPQDYRWSSHNHYAFGRRDEFVAPHEEYRALGPTDAKRQQEYRKLFASDLEDDALDEIRYATTRGWPLGDETFKDNLEATLQRATRPPKRGRPGRKENLDLTPI
jgi:putative transposase